MSRLPVEVWDRLAGQQTLGDALTARIAVPDLAARLLAAIDADGGRHFLVLLRGDETEIHDAQSRGVEVVTRELAVPDHAAGRYLDIACRDAAGYEAFDVIGGEIAERLATARLPAPAAVERVLAKWRRFWGQVPKQMLSREEQIGLFAEMWFLSVWLCPVLGPAPALGRWRGPFGSRHDFESPSVSVEVKATASTRARIHRIHGIDQLAPPTQGRLLFFSLQLREEGSATNSLSGVIAAFRQLIQSDPDASSDFDRALAESGYSPAHDEEYERARFRVVSEGLYRVEDDFPRLTNGSFATRMPGGIEHIDYDVNLSGYEHLLVAAQPLGAPLL